jgi:hypothetical protein
MQPKTAGHTYPCVACLFGGDGNRPDAMNGFSHGVCANLPPVAQIAYNSDE